MLKNQQTCWKISKSAEKSADLLIFFCWKISKNEVFKNHQKVSNSAEKSANLLKNQQTCWKISYYNIWVLYNKLFVMTYISRFSYCKNNIFNFFRNLGWFNFFSLENQFFFSTFFQVLWSGFPSDFSTQMVLSMIIFNFQVKKG